jgi:long-subunit acyl-CoA synthetase (AMP-forming)
LLEAHGSCENVLPQAINRIGAHCFGVAGHPLPGKNIAVAAVGAVRVRGPGQSSGYCLAAGARTIVSSG